MKCNTCRPLRVWPTVTFVITVICCLCIIITVSVVITIITTIVFPQTSMSFSNEGWSGWLHAMPKVHSNTIITFLYFLTCILLDRVERCFNQYLFWLILSITIWIKMLLKDTADLYWKCSPIVDKGFHLIFHFSLLCRLLISFSHSLLLSFFKFRVQLILLEGPLQNSWLQEF